jgi:hypothetical protein
MLASGRSRELDAGTSAASNFSIGDAKALKASCSQPGLTFAPDSVTIEGGTMKQTYLALALLTTTVLATGPGSAATLNFVATPAANFAPPGTSGFSIAFTDADGDQLLSSSDPILGFSSVTFGSVYTTVEAVPSIDGFTNSTVDTFWRFDNPIGATGGLSVQKFDWTYQISPVSQVPLPGALPLFITGLGALGLFGRLAKRKAAPHAS